jgi:thiopurine S-methyltransferase
MEQSFWRERWDDGRIGFHEALGNELLRHHWPELLARQRARGVDAGSRVLVPLCGKTTDLTWLREFGHDVVGVEFVETAAVAYFAERGVTPRRFERGGAVCYEYDGVSIWVADFLEMNPEHVGTFDLIYDRAALVALAPEQRQRYIDRLALLSNPGALLFLISFEHDFGSGPPFSAAGVESWMAPAFTLERRFEHDILETEPRFKERGASYMIEIAWFGTRRAG